MKTNSSDHVESFLDGEIVFREGEVSRDMFVIQRGAVEVTKRGESGEILLATLERGSFFGETALLDSQPRSATVRAKGETRLLVIEPGSLLIKFRRDPTFAFEMLQHLSARISEFDERLARLMAERAHPTGGERATPPTDASTELPAALISTLHEFAPRARPPVTARRP